MGAIKGYESNGWQVINRPIKFMKAVQTLPPTLWGEPWYVDYSGTDGKNGRSVAEAVKYLQKAIDGCAAGDTLFIRPYQTAAQMAGGDPAYILPESTENFHIPASKHSIALIGCGSGPKEGAAYQTNLKGSTTVQSTPTLDIRAPFVGLENLTFRRGGNTLCGVRFSFADPGTTYAAFGGWVYNCQFWKIGSTATGGALLIDSAWYTVVMKSRFLSCYNGIYIAAGNSVPVGLRFEDVEFQALPAEVDANILSSGAVTNILMRRLYMSHTIPSGGTNNKYIVIGAASTGLLTDSYIGAAATAVATNTTLNGIKYSQVRTGDNTNIMATA